MGTQLILIIDEAHLSAFTGPQAIAVRKLIGAKVEILVTATPNSRPQRTVSISRKKVVEEGMIKKGVRLNIGLDPDKQSTDNVHIHLLRTAFEKKKELAALYDAELGKGVVNPLLLIQLPSDIATLSDEDKSIRETLEGLLNSPDYDITTANGRLAVWLSGEQNRVGLEDMNGFQDVLIFKQAIAQGWDCPRAAVLVSYRNVQSPNFGIQTVGRILRMPHQKHYQQDALNHGYVYTNIATNHIKFEPSDADFFHPQVAERQNVEGWVFDKLTTQTIINDRATKGVLTSEFKEIFFQIMEDAYGVVKLSESVEGKSDSYQTWKAKFDSQKAANRKAMEEKFWQFDIDEHQIRIATDVEIDPYEVTAIALSNDKIKRFSYTTAEFGQMFDKFCFDSLTQLNREKSWKKLKTILVEFAEEYLGIVEHEIRKVYLFPVNKAILIKHIVTALYKFEQQGNDKRRPGENESWEVPKTRSYNDLHKRLVIENHALTPFFEYEKASNPEIALREFLVKESAHLDWWYKNGDQGKEHFAVTYKDMHGVLRLFYVDFIIKFKSGKIGLFDTKTKRSDAEAPNKHNALLDYMNLENTKNPTRTLVGGVLIPELISDVMTFRYCSNKITDTNDLTGWEFFSPSTI